VGLDKEMFGVAAPAVEPWQGGSGSSTINELGGAKPLAFVRPVRGTHNSPPDLSSSWTSLRRRARTKRSDGISSPTMYVVAKGVQLRLLRQRVVMTAQNTQGRTCSSTASTTALPGWDAAAKRRDAQDEFHSAAQQAQAWAGGGFDADRGFVIDGVGRSARWSRVRGPIGRRRRLRAALGVGGGKKEKTLASFRPWKLEHSCLQA
jgi:hypothetical protein